MWRYLPALLSIWMLSACSSGGSSVTSPGPAAAGVASDKVSVKHDSRSRETAYTATLGDCSIVWTTFETDINRHVIRSRVDCGLALREQVPLIGMLLNKVMSGAPAPPGYRTLDWGRLLPDGAKDATMSLRLALAAKRSVEWDVSKGEPRNGDINGWVRRLANEALIYPELLTVFRQSGLEVRLSAVEKVLVLPAQKLPFYADLRARGVRASDKLPFDCQAWFSMGPAGQNTN